MNEEEKKAIEKLKGRVKIDRQLRDKVESDFDKFCEDECIAIEIVLNLVGKQQKEIKNLAQKSNELVDEYEKELLEKNNYIFRLENETEALHKLIDEEMG